MPRTFLRGIAILLIACLVMDSSFAAAFSQEHSFAGQPLAQAVLYQNLLRISEEALGPVQLSDHLVLQPSRWPNLHDLRQWRGIMAAAAVLNHRLSPRLQHLSFVILYGTFYILQRHAVTHITTLQFLTGLFLSTSVFTGFIMLASFRLRGGVRSEGRLVFQAFRENPRWLWTAALWGVLLQYVDVLLFSIPFARGWGSPAEFTSMDALSTFFIGLWIWILYGQKVKSNIWLSGLMIPVGAFLLALIRPASDIPAGVSIFYRAIGFGMFAAVAAVLARTILGTGRLFETVQASAGKSSSAKTFAENYSPIISFIQAFASFIAAVLTGPWISTHWLGQTASAWIWNPTTVAAGAITAVAWWGMFRAISKGLTPSQFIPAFNSMPVWVLFWSLFFNRTALPSLALAPIAILACCIIAGGAYIGNQNDLKSALHPLKRLLLNRRQIAA